MNNDVYYPKPDPQDIDRFIKEASTQNVIADDVQSGGSVISFIRYIIAILLSLFVGYNIYVGFNKCYPGSVPKYKNKIRRVLFGDDVIDRYNKTDLSKELKSTPTKKMNTRSVGPVKQNKKTVPIMDESEIKYCYIGTEKGNRSCVDIDKAYKCMSGDIFPSMSECVKPTVGQ